MAHPSLGNVDQTPEPGAAPEFAMQVAEEHQRLLDALPDNWLRAVAVRKMEGHTNEESAAKLGRAVRNVERKLQQIRRTLEPMSAAEEDR
jgi:DNA-directed RNA polymerase specialized sigma24 family protein